MKLMKLGKIGDVPLPYIIALVLGIIVIVLVAYWLFVEGGLFSSSITEKGCEAKKLAYCSDWKVKGTPDKMFSAACATVNADPNKATTYYAPECCIFPWATNVGWEACGITTTS
jgi:hypothetical protein